MSFCAYPSYGNHHNATGMALYGDLTVLQTRWHELIRAAQWQVLTVYRGRFDSYHCVMDDYGDLIPTEMRITVDDEGEWK